MNMDLCICHLKQYLRVDLPVNIHSQPQPPSLRPVPVATGSMIARLRVRAENASFAMQVQVWHLKAVS